MITNAIALTVALAIVGCTSAQPPGPPPTLTQGEPRGGCALGVSGAIARVTDTADGVVVTFTSAENVNELRERANDAAAQHGPADGLGRGHDGRHGEGGDHGLQLFRGPALKSVAEDIPGGARILLVPKSSIDRALVLEKARERANAMNARTCK